jgi:hypothetical protein
MTSLVMLPLMEVQAEAALVDLISTVLTSVIYSVIYLVISLEGAAGHPLEAMVP